MNCYSIWGTNFMRQYFQVIFLVTIKLWRWKLSGNFFHNVWITSEKCSGKQKPLLAWLFFLHNTWVYHRVIVGHTSQLFQLLPSTQKKQHPWGHIHSLPKNITLSKGTELIVHTKLSNLGMRNPSSASGKVDVGGLGEVRTRRARRGEKRMMGRQPHSRGHKLTVLLLTHVQAT